MNITEILRMSNKSRARKYRKIFRALRVIRNRKVFRVHLDWPITTPNANGRVYTEGLFDVAIDKFRADNKTVRLVGGLDHPAILVNLDGDDIPDEVKAVLNSHKEAASFSVRSEVPDELRRRWEQEAHVVDLSLKPWPHTPTPGNHQHQGIGSYLGVWNDESNYVLPPGIGQGNIADWDKVHVSEPGIQFVNKVNKPIISPMEKWREAMLDKAGFSEEMLLQQFHAGQVEFNTAFTAVEATGDDIEAMSVAITTMLSKSKTIAEIKNATLVPDTFCPVSVEDTRNEMINRIREMAYKTHRESNYEEALAAQMGESLVVKNLFKDGYKVVNDVLVYVVTKEQAESVQGMYLPDHCPRGSHIPEDSIGHQACLEILLNDPRVGSSLVLENLISMQLNDVYYICQLSTIITQVKHSDFFNKDLRSLVGEEALKVIDNGKETNA